MSTPGTGHFSRSWEAYRDWLGQQPLAANTQRAYKVQVRRYCAYLGSLPSDYGDPLREPHARDYAVRDYKLHLQSNSQVKPSSVNLALAALDHFHRFLGLGPAKVSRAGLPEQAPKALTLDEQKRLLRAVERCAGVRDRAVALLLLYTALRLGECAALDVGDVPLSARKGKVIVRAGKGGAYREVPLNSEVRGALEAWLAERRQRFAVVAEPALFLSRQGRRLSTRAMDLLLRRFGRAAGLDFSAHTLRHTCLTNLVRQGTDLVLVAELAGHKRLETTRRYSLPSEQDRAAAMERLRLAY